MFQVLENGKPADSNSFNLKKNNGWDCSIFEKKREAEVYAYTWCFPCSKQKALNEAPEMELDKKYYISGAGDYIQIVEVK